MVNIRLLLSVPLQRRLSVGTVNSSQGQERDIMTITLTRSNPQGDIGLLSDIRRMNVGMTRARRVRWPNRLESVMVTASSHLQKPGYCVHRDPQNGFGRKG